MSYVSTLYKGLDDSRLLITVKTIYLNQFDCIVKSSSDSSFIATYKGSVDVGTNLIKNFSKSFRSLLHNIALNNCLITKYKEKLSISIQFIKNNNLASRADSSHESFKMLYKKQD